MDPIAKLWLDRQIKIAERKKMIDFCPFCHRHVKWYHQHWGPRFMWKYGQPPFNHAVTSEEPKG